MLLINKLEDAYLIEKKLIFGNSICNKDYINLRPHSNTDDILSTMNRNDIDFPGEYDIDKIYIKAIAGKGESMNYFIKTEKKSFAIIQDPKILEQDDLLKIGYWIFDNEKTEKKIEQLELDGEKIDLTKLESN